MSTQTDDYIHDCQLAAIHSYLLTASNDTVVSTSLCQPPFHRSQVVSNNLQVTGTAGCSCHFQTRMACRHHHSRLIFCPRSSAPPVTVTVTVTVRTSVLVAEDRGGPSETTMEWRHGAQFSACTCSLALVLFVSKDKEKESPTLLNNQMNA